MKHDPVLSAEEIFSLIMRLNQPGMIQKGSRRIFIKMKLVMHNSIRNRIH